MKRTPSPRRVHVSSSNFRQLVRHAACNGPRDKYPEVRVRLPDRLTDNLRTSQRPRLVVAVEDLVRGGTWPWSWPYAGHHKQDGAGRSVVRLGGFGRLDSTGFILQDEVVAAETLRHERLDQRMDAQGENTGHNCGALRNSHETWAHRRRSSRAKVN
ncbi:hypothetical protein COCC4DRAFT_133006 [Bipolaris maydis ATCC 48331]|uniref:Uncharacterized protein n=2 Tax=Cochliobolus heterostrophus TaxID=5016 RepID=M2V0D5_COCH5|nr:uncharacterized protein COCC4DRAFT_133006 [Bipolaris maydis ATCC 48331]EMD93407.1 hypothetical protein COCHEDRAFT_1028592 [Bipolaris maydis C5]ENI07145.1 hypothetical protein COCC4DRAFT_133006 [Bipolaris maydis ATCC 48331]